MNRVFAGLRAARVRPDRAVRISLVAGCALLLAACGPGKADISPLATTTAPTTTAAPASTTAAPASTTAAPVTASAAPTPAAVPVPALVGMSVGQAKAALATLGLRWRTTVARTARYVAGTVIAQSHGTDRRLNPGSVVTLTVAAAPLSAPKPAPKPPPKPAPKPVPANCDRSYPGVCLTDGIGDYDCSGGSGNGPNYVDGPIRVLPPDPFDLDRDGNGSGCE